MDSKKDISKDKHNDKDNKNSKGDEDMADVAEITRRLKSKSKRKTIPHLNMVNGKVVINPNDPKQVKWFEEFKK